MEHLMRPRALRPYRVAGFSLTELVVVLAVISLIAAIAVPTFSSVRSNAAQRVALASAEAVARNAFALAVQSSSTPLVDAGGFGSSLAAAAGEADGIDLVAGGPDGEAAGTAENPSAVSWTLRHENGNQVDVFFDPDSQRVWVGGASTSPENPSENLPEGSTPQGEQSVEGVGFTWIIGSDPNVEVVAVLFDMGPNFPEVVLRDISQAGDFFDNVSSDWRISCWSNETQTDIPLPYYGFPQGEGTYSFANFVDVENIPAGEYECYLEDFLEGDLLTANILTLVFADDNNDTNDNNDSPGSGEPAEEGDPAGGGSSGAGAISISYSSTGFSLGSEQQLSPSVTGAIAPLFSFSGTLPAGVTFDTETGEFRTSGLYMTAEGSVDTSFQDPNVYREMWRNVQTIAPLPDGKMVIGGYFTEVGGQARNNIARLNADGTLDSSFVAQANGRVTAVSLLADGGLLIAGDFTSVNGVSRTRLARLDANGNVDSSFADPGVNGLVSAIAPLADGRVVIGGDFTQVAGLTRGRVAVLTGSGAVDLGFQDPEVDGLVRAVAVDEDGRVVVGGSFATVQGESRGRVARLNGDGTLDSGFQQVTLQAEMWWHSTWVQTIVIQPDGKILIGGRFAEVSGSTRASVARLNETGSIDAGFQNPGVAGDSYPQVSTIALQPDGKLLIAGEFSTVDGEARRSVARLESDGALDTSFVDPAVSGEFPNVSVVVLQPDSKILLGGMFTGVGSEWQRGVARLGTQPPSGFPFSGTVTVTDGTSSATTGVTVTLMLE
jgi:uncharacterized delta-60 repeat protein/prepilin-type N-terminal cleavage/methylation domain-containing protein